MTVAMRITFREFSMMCIATVSLSATVIPHRRFFHEFHAEFNADLTRYKEKRVHCMLVPKNTHLFAAILRPFGPERQNFNT